MMCTNKYMHMCILHIPKYSLLSPYIFTCMCDSRVENLALDNVYDEYLACICVQAPHMCLELMKIRIEHNPL